MFLKLIAKVRAEREAVSKTLEEKIVYRHSSNYAVARVDLFKYVLKKRAGRWIPIHRTATVAAAKSYIEKLHGIESHAKLPGTSS